MIRALLKEARPKQWTKNVLVFAAPGAAGVLSHSQPLSRALITFVALSMKSRSASSMISRNSCVGSAVPWASAT